MTAVSTTISSKPFSKWLISITMLLSLLSFTAPATTSGNVISATSTEQQFFRRVKTNAGTYYFQHFKCKRSCAKNLREYGEPGAGNAYSIRNSKIFTSLRFNHLLEQYVFYKSILQFSACRILLLPAPESRLS